MLPGLGISDLRIIWIRNLLTRTFRWASTTHYSLKPWLPVVYRKSPSLACFYYLSWSPTYPVNCSFSVTCLSMIPRWEIQKLIQRSPKQTYRQTGQKKNVCFWMTQSQHLHFDPHLSPRLPFSTQCGKPSLLSQITSTKNLHAKNIQTTQGENLPLVLVRLPLKYCVEGWSPNSIRDISAIEKVQEIETEYSWFQVLDLNQAITQT